MQTKCCQHAPVRQYAPVHMRRYAPDVDETAPVHAGTRQMQMKWRRYTPVRAGCMPEARQHFPTVLRTSDNTALPQ